MLKFDFFLPLLVTTFVAIVGWIVAHRFTAKRDLDNKRRDLRVTFLIDAFRRIADAANRTEHAKNEHNQKLESAISDIQLFGTKDQVELAHEFSIQIAMAGTSDLTKLLEALRADLRTELNLEQVANQVAILRFKNPE